MPRRTRSRLKHTAIRSPAIATAIAGALTASAAAQEIYPGMTPPEKIALLDNLVEMRTLTSGPYHHSHAYPTSRTWSRDGHWLFVEGAGPGPDGDAKPDAWHLMAIHVETGERRYLLSVTHPSPGTHGGALMIDYAPNANVIAWVDPTQREIHLLDVETRRTCRVVHEPEGKIEGPLTIAPDGTRIAYWATFPSVANRFFDDYITVIFYVDVDPAAHKPLSEPRIIEAYPRRKGPTWSKDNPRDGVHVNHPQLNPHDKDHLTFAHEMLGSRPDGSIARSRLWHTRVDGSRMEPLIRQPAGLDFTHEVIAPDGKSLIFPYMFGVGQVFFDTRETRSLYYHPHCCPGHITVSPDGQWIAGETWGRPKGPDGREKQSIMMFDVPTRRFAHLVWFNLSHPHAHFSPDGTRIAFSFRDDAGFQQVAVIDVRDVQNNWPARAQGTAGDASPAWKQGVAPTRIAD